MLNHKPLETESYCVRITVCRDKLPYADDAGSPASNWLETKFLINSTISDAFKGARFLGADISDFFLSTPMAKAEFVKVEYSHIPADIITHNNLQNKVANHGYIYICIKKGMYGLKQAAILAYDNLQRNLKPFGYSHVVGTIGI